MKILALFIFLFFSIGLDAQNPSYVLMDSVYTLFDKGENKKAIELWKQTDSLYRIDPRDESLVLIYFWNALDTTNFKIGLMQLIEHNGLEIDDCKGYSFYFECKAGGLKEWYNSVYPDLHNLYLKNHQNDTLINNQFTKIYLLDQSGKYILQGMNETERDVDSINFYQILEICHSIKKLPTSFEYHWGVSGVLGLILLHNLKNAPLVTAEKRWNEILPFLVQAYNKGNLDDDFIRLYDGIMFEFHGFQYYGTIKDAPIKDVEGLDLRRKQIGLN